MLEIVAEIVKSGHAEELREIVKQYELDVSKRDVSKRKEKEKK